jgi:hypothetical protein
MKKVSRIRNVVAVIVLAVLSQSCASMFSGTMYTANVSATKPNSEIYINGKLKGTDKVTVRQNRKTEMQIEVKNQGQTEDFTVYKSIKWGSQVANLLNWVYFVPVGTIVDAATGAVWQPEHKDVPEVTKVNNKNFNIVINNSK